MDDTEIVEATPPAPRRLLPIALLAGVVAGVLAFGAGEAIARSYRGAMFPPLKIRPTPDDLRMQAAATVECAGITFATLGGLLGLALGLAGGLGRRAVVGLVLGASVGGVMTLVLVPIFQVKQDREPDSLVLPLLTHGAIWASLGAVAGLTFGLGAGPGRWKPAVVGGIVGAALATVVYEIAGAVVFSTAHTERPLAATAIPRGMAHLLVAGLAAAGAALAMTSRPVPAGPIEPAGMPDQ